MALILGWVAVFGWLYHTAVVPAAQRVHTTIYTGLPCATDTECMDQHGGDGGPR